MCLVKSVSLHDKTSELLDTLTLTPQNHTAINIVKKAIISIIVLSLFCLLATLVINTYPLTTPLSQTVFSTTGFPRQFDNGTGTIITISQPPQHIVSQTLATDEILLAICAPQRIAALSPLATDSNYSNVVESARKLGRTLNNLEQLLTLQPDLVLTAHYNRAELLTLLNQVRIPAVRLTHFNQLQDIQNNIRLVGYAIGEDDKANALITQMNISLAALRAQLPMRQTPRVMSYSIEGFTAGADTTFDAMLQAIGALNLSAEHGIKGIVNISSEQLIAWQPEFIVVGAAAEQFDAISQQLHAQPAFKALNGKLILLEQRYLLAASHHIVVAIQQLAEKIYER